MFRSTRQLGALILTPPPRCFGRCRIVRRLAYEVFEIYGADPLINLATTLEQVAR